MTKLKKIMTKIKDLFVIKTTKNSDIFKIDTLYDNIKEIEGILLSAGFKLENIQNIQNLGGMTNKNFLIFINNKKYVLRVSGAGTQ
ncbi:MAG: hypothetical protein Q4A58_04175 [Fusobacterium sp.]|uniref:hypothetical protein n=1 Tax=Fusobacterium sp. TaxID=68766 RepID=UPI0026DD4532|nr:hypothetical protein [Fusobacterium sp.]MDO4690473.1 hypothetical protein [Fusobacterium sp.]